MSCYVCLLQPESQNGRKPTTKKVKKIYMKILLGAASKTKLKSCALHRGGTKFSSATFAAATRFHSMEFRIQHRKLSQGPIELRAFCDVAGMRA